MAATAADPRGKPPAPPHHLNHWPPCPTISASAGDRQREGGAAAADYCDGDGDGCLEELRAKLMGHLRDAADRMRLAPAPEPPPEAKEPSPPAPPPPAAEAATRPWNLRSRRRRRAANPRTATAWSSSLAAAAAEEEEERRAQFSVSLTAEEIEEDIYAVTGSRPRRRPRKRPRGVQRQLDSLFPGLWLTEITADLYKVPDV